MKIINISDKSSLETAIEILKSNDIVIFPTDTVYGIGCILNKTAIRKLYKIKNRPTTQPTAVLITKKLSTQTTLNIPLTRICAQREIQNDFLAGTLTLILPSKIFKISFPKMILSGDNKIGVRLPKYKWLENLINIVGPIVATSANKKGDTPPKNFAEISPDLIKLADLTIKTDENLGGKPSVVFDLVKNQVLR